MTTTAHDRGRELRALSVRGDMNVGELIQELKNTSFAGRRVALACELARSWREEPSRRVIVTVSGALSVANQTSLLAQLVDNGLVHAIVATGAIITHSLIQEGGGLRRAVLPDETDEQLAREGLNRVFDTIESDANLEKVSLIIDDVLKSLTGSIGSNEIVRSLGTSRLLVAPGVIASASRCDVPIFVPALSDSELGLRLYKRQSESPHWMYDAFADLHAYRSWLVQGTTHAILSLGGGVPRNWAQQMFAEFDARPSVPELTSGIRICPDPAELGHLSGSTFSEARSWRKIPAYNPSLFIEVPADATIVFPLVAASMLSA